MTSRVNVKSTPPQSSPALRAREEARSKIKMGPNMRWDDDNYCQNNTPFATTTTGV